MDSVTVRIVTIGLVVVSLGAVMGLTVVDLAKGDVPPVLGALAGQCIGSLCGIATGLALGRNGGGGPYKQEGSNDARR